MPYFGKHQEMLGDFLRGDHRAAGQRMARRHNQANFVAIDVDHLQALFLDGKLREPEIGGVLHHRLHHARAIAAQHLQLHGGKLRAVFGKDFGEHVDAGGFIGRDHEFAARVGFQFGDGVLHAAAKVEHLLRVLGKNLAGGGE